MKKIITIDSLKVGMYLTRVVSSTAKLKVKSQGKIQSQQTVDNLKNRGVSQVEIDYEKSDSTHKIAMTKNAQEQLKKSNKTGQTKSAAPKKIKNFDQQQQDLAKADKLYSHAKQVQAHFFRQMKSTGSPNFDELSQLADDIVDSVFDNQDALSCLVMLKEADDYLVQHSLNSAILMSIFARHLELSREEIEDLTVAGLLLDIGMATLPPELNADEATFSAEQKMLMYTHVSVGVELLEKHPDIPQLVKDVVQNHHERIDGSGYPRGIKDLSIYEQMASIVDSYDAMLTLRPYHLASNCQEALELLESNKSYDSELVRAFFKAIGLYPVGSLVQLKSDKLAMVVQANPDNQLRPKVMSFYHLKNKHHLPIKIVDLKRSTDKIKVAVRPEEFNINLPKFFRTAVLP